MRAHPREDVAAAAQAVFEDAIEEVARDLLARTGKRRLAVNGGVFANVKLNQRLAALPELDRLFVFPAMSDTGNSVGAALFLVFENGEQKNAETLRSVYWGSEWDEKACARALCRGRLRARTARRGRAGQPAPRTRSTRAAWWAGSRVAWNSGRARSATAAWWRGRPTTKSTRP